MSGVLGPRCEVDVAVLHWLTHLEGWYRCDSLKQSLGALVTPLVKQRPRTKFDRSLNGDDYGATFKACGPLISHVISRLDDKDSGEDVGVY
jgi:hypothetical protein